MLDGNTEQRTKEQYGQAEHTSYWLQTPTFWLAATINEQTLYTTNQIQNLVRVHAYVYVRLCMSMAYSLICTVLFVSS